MAIIDMLQIEKVAKLLKDLPDGEDGHNFYSFETESGKVIARDMYPYLHHPQAVDFFFFEVLHEHGFWYKKNEKWGSSIFGFLNGVNHKGSDALFRMVMRVFDKDPFVVRPERLLKMSFGEMVNTFFTDDIGTLFPDLDVRYELTQEYAQWFADEGTTPEGILSLAHLSHNPGGFLEIMRTVGGYNRDPFEKKNNLLAMILANRPEVFLNADTETDWKPIVDYHTMRLALRLGLVQLTEAKRTANIERLVVGADDEEDIRKAVYSAVELLVEESGRTMSFIDEKMWGARAYCPESKKPDCSKCAFESVCKKDIELFQPVLRTTAY